MGHRAKPENLLDLLNSILGTLCATSHCGSITMWHGRLRGRRHLGNLGQIQMNRGASASHQTTQVADN